MARNRANTSTQMGQILSRQMSMVKGITYQEIIIKWAAQNLYYILFSAHLHFPPSYTISITFSHYGFQSTKRTSIYFSSNLNINSHSNCLIFDPSINCITLSTQKAYLLIVFITFTTFFNKYIYGGNRYLHTFSFNTLNLFIVAVNHKKLS